MRAVGRQLLMCRELVWIGVCMLCGVVWCGVAWRGLEWCVRVVCEWCAHVGGGRGVVVAWRGA